MVDYNDYNKRYPNKKDSFATKIATPTKTIRSYQQQPTMMLLQRNDMIHNQTATTMVVLVLMMIIVTIMMILVRMTSQYQPPAKQQQQQQQQPPPHIIMIMVDDLGWNGFSLNGNNHEVHNPTLSQLAKEDGIILQNYYVYKYCSPSRASFLTGRVPGHGIWEQNPSDSAEVGVNIKATMIPALLKTKANYSTHQIGKWHQGFYAPRYTPLGRGFDTSFGFYLGACDHFTSCANCGGTIPYPDYSNRSFVCPALPNGCNVSCPIEGGIDLQRNNQPGYGENGTYTSYLWSKEAVDIIKQNAIRNNNITIIIIQQQLQHTDQCLCIWHYTMFINLLRHHPNF